MRGGDKSNHTIAERIKRGVIAVAVRIQEGQHRSKFVNLEEAARGPMIPDFFDPHQQSSAWRSYT
jgi:hypothetical protein